MAMGKSYSVGMVGFEGLVIEVEAYLGAGAAGVCLVGLPDASLQESRDRVRAAVHNSGAAWPQGRVTLALSPATVRKVGSVHDAALAVAVLVASGGLPAEAARRAVVLGELALDGRLRPVRGVLPAVLAARKAGWSDVVVPEANLSEAGLVSGMRVHGAPSLRALCSWLRGERELPGPPERPGEPPVQAPDLADVVGHEEARFALEVAAAGAHHLMLTGPPGVGKTLLASRLVGLLPQLTAEESLEVTALHSLAGSLSEEHPVVLRPPFIAPHHTASVPALVGGGVGTAAPGAVSKAHCGVLFLDECAEIGARALESLRTPLEEGEVRIARRDGVVRYPARFQLVLACNPCPCAPSRDLDCVCPPQLRRRYLGKLSGPLMDRVDLRVRLHQVSAGMFESERAESSETVRARVVAARGAARERWQSHGWRTNAEVPGPVLRQQFPLGKAALRPVELALRRGVVSARGADRCVRVAWTLSDLAGKSSPTVDEVAQALSFRDRSAA
ncbi:MAG: YifB family Mg chelatase-like AAA ATPase [Segniliparus sp.]|uniref:YifB family Mg chelatase-like AAA ATPase n=1 Tax=Segniliparus sp. TaxID=2804064 RepID=UPI003F2FC8CF